MASSTRSRRVVGSLASGVCYAAILGGVFVEQATAQEPVPALTRIRSSNRTTAELIARTSGRSLTFKALVERFQNTDGIVHIEFGECGFGVRGCLLAWLNAAGGYRYLRITVDRRLATAEDEFMALVGHELQHAIEAVSEPGVTSGPLLYHFFDRIGRTGNTRFETPAALDAGDAVRSELQAHRRRSAR